MVCSYVGYETFGLATRSWRWLAVREFPVGLSECRRFVDTTMERRERRHATVCRGKWKWCVSISIAWTALLCLSPYIATCTSSSGNRLMSAFEDVPVRPNVADDWGARLRFGNKHSKQQQLDVARLPPTVVSLSRQLKEKWATRGQMPALTELGLTNCSDITALHIVTPSAILPQLDRGHRFSLKFQPRHLKESTTIKNVLLRVEAVFDITDAASALRSQCSRRREILASQPLCFAVKAKVHLDGSVATRFSAVGGTRRLLDCANASSGAFGAVREVFTFNVTELLSKLTDVEANGDLTFVFKVHQDKDKCQPFPRWNVQPGDNSSLLYVRGHPVTGFLSCAGVPLSKVQRRPSTSPGCPGQDCYRKPWRINIGSMAYFVSPLILVEAQATDIDLGQCIGSCRHVQSTNSPKCSDVAVRAALSDRLYLLHGSVYETILTPTCVPSLVALQGRWIVYAIKDDNGSASKDSSPTPYVDSGMVYFETLVIPNSGGCECR